MSIVQVCRRVRVRGWPSHVHTPRTTRLMASGQRACVGEKASASSSTPLRRSFRLAGVKRLSVAVMWLPLAR